MELSDGVDMGRGDGSFEDVVDVFGENGGWVGLEQFPFD